MSMSNSLVLNALVSLNESNILFMKSDDVNSAPLCISTDTNYDYMQVTKYKWL